MFERRTLTLNYNLSFSRVLVEEMNSILPGYTSLNLCTVSIGSSDVQSSDISSPTLVYILEDLVSPLRL